MKRRLLIYLQQFIVIFIREILIWWRQKFKVFTTVTQPFIWTVFFGLGLGRVIDINEIAQVLNYSGKLSYLLFIYPGMIATTVIFIAFSIGNSFVIEKERGFLKPLLLTPTPTWVITLGKIIAAGTIGALQGLIVNLLGFLYFKDIAVTFITFPILMVLGILTSSISLLLSIFFNFPESYNALLFYLVIPTILLSGAFFPIELTPLWMIKLAQFNPFYYGVEMVKKSFLASLSLERDFSNFKEIILIKGPSILENLLIVIFFIIVFNVIVNVIIRKKSFD